MNVPGDENRRILLVDDNASIHQDFRKILAAATGASAAAASAAEAALFGDDAADAGDARTTAGAAPPVQYEIDSAMQGAEALEQVEQARRGSRPFALAFVDVRMPPGWDGIETVRRIWDVEPDLQVVICTAFSDYSWPEMVAELGRTDRLLILKKPFDPVEVCQLAAALTEKWNVTLQSRVNLEAALRAEKEARAYAGSLELVNRALESSWAKSESELRRQREFLMRTASEVLAPAQLLLLQQLDVAGLERGDAASLLALERLGQPAAAIVSALGSVLELAALDAGAARPRHTRCSPWRIANEVGERVRDDAAARGVEISVTRSEDAPDDIESDPVRLRRVLAELVANALRHTSNGTVRITLTPAEDRVVAPSGVTIRVSDSGPGLSRESLTHLFEPFGAGGAVAGGARVGLGLVVCKRTATMLGGDLVHERRVEPGASFVLTLPLAAPSSKDD